VRRIRLSRFASFMAPPRRASGCPRISHVASVFTEIEASSSALTEGALKEVVRPGAGMPHIGGEHGPAAGFETEGLRATRADQLRSGREASAVL
jgi:hypothetical protein